MISSGVGLMAVTSFRQSILIQARVIHALMMREMVASFGRNNFGFLWIFLIPTLFILGFSALLSLRMSTEHSLPILPFVLTGYSAFIVIRGILGRSQSAIRSNLGLLYHRNVTIMDLFIARAALESVATTTVYVVLMLVFMISNWMSPPQDVLSMMIGWLLLIWFAFGLGLIAGVLSFRSEIFSRIFQFFMLLLVLFSGAMFMVDWLPSQHRQLILWFPVVHGVEYMREGYFGYQVTAHYNLFYLIMSNVLLTVIGYISVWKVRDFIEMK